MGGFRRLSLLVLTFSVIGAALVVLAVVQRFTGNGAGSGMPAYMFLTFQGVLMGAIAAVGSVVSGTLKAQADQIEALERRLSQTPGAPSEQIRT